MPPDLDLLTRKWWRAVGRRVDLAGEHAWLDAPISAGPVAALDGPGFDSAQLRPEVRSFHEEFHVYVDDEGVLRTDHVLRLWSATAVRLHYRLEPRTS